jgi:acyl carrier protein
MVAKIWQEVLAIDNLSVHDNFFELGGHSLTATRLLSRLVDSFHVELPLRAIFDRPTIANLAQFIEDANNGPQKSRMPAIRPLQRQAYAATVSGGKLQSSEAPPRVPSGTRARD